MHGCMYALLVPWSELILQNTCEHLHNRSEIMGQLDDPEYHVGFVDAYRTSTRIKTVTEQSLLCSRKSVKTRVFGQGIAPHSAPFEDS